MQHRIRKAYHPTKAMNSLKSVSSTLLLLFVAEERSTGGLLLFQAVGMESVGLEG